MSGKIILITGSIKVHPGANQPMLQLNRSYMSAVEAAGGIPLAACSARLAEGYAEIADGLMITGGESVHPRYFGETLTHLAGGDPQEIAYLAKGCFPARDELELALYREFCKRKKPVMGICRGFQLINAAEGGKNMLDFPRDHKYDHSNGISHKVIAEEGSALERLFGREFSVNSYHRDCAVTPGAALKVTARSEDGLIEAFEHESLPVIGFQFHPEKMRGDAPEPAEGPSSDPLFRYFIEMCK
ncbi:MAG: gamma-glutamyl-gamma-aminobutyrate hydrolase family protein [Firmicutes bacterium]|nr:gamma-glutamyl-gamma-aminobutyrate hydrolase family protein [Bacillota bacterium]